MGPRTLLSVALSVCLITAQAAGHTLASDAVPHKRRLWADLLGTTPPGLPVAATLRVNTAASPALRPGPAAGTPVVAGTSANVTRPPPPHLGPGPPIPQQTSIATAPPAPVPQLSPTTSVLVPAGTSHTTAPAVPQVGATALVATGANGASTTTNGTTPVAAAAPAAEVWDFTGGEYLWTRIGAVSTVYCLDCSVTTNAAEMNKPNVVVLRNDKDINIQGYHIKLVGGGIQAPGRMVTIIAAVLDCATGSCLIDVSGKSATDQYEQAARGFDGTTGNVNGGNGNNATFAGKNGGNGGKINLWVEQLSYNIFYNLNGGNGGPGQAGGDGGDGAQPAHKPGTHCGSFTGDGVAVGCVQHFMDGFCTDNFCEIEEWSGMPGDPAGNGGNAGANAANGNGGNGGKGTFAWFKLLPPAQPHSQLNWTYAGGIGGYQTVQGQPGKGGAGGLGGCPSQKVWSYNWAGACTKSECFMALDDTQILGPNERCPVLLNMRKATNGAEGAPGQDGQPSVLPLRGKTGAQGQFTVWSGDGGTGLPVSRWSDLDTAPEFLSMLLNGARDAFLRADITSARRMARFVVDASASCRPAAKQNCAVVGDQAKTMLYRICQGQSYYGTPPGWVPTLSYDYINQALTKLPDGVLPMLKLMEDAHKDLLAAKDNMAKRQTAMISIVDATQRHINDLQSHVTGLHKEIKDNMDRLTELGQAKGVYQQQFLASSGAFEVAMQKAYNEKKMWLGVKTAVDATKFISTAVGMGVKLYGGASTGDLGKVGDAISAYGTAVQGEADVIADIRAQMELKPPPQLDRLVVLTNNTPAGWAVAQKAMGSDPDKARCLVEKAALDKLLDAYKDLDAGTEYQAAAAAYTSAAQNLNDMLALISHQIGKLEEWQKGIAAANVQLAASREQLKTANNPVLAAGLVASSARLRELQDRALFYLYQRLQAAKYALVDLSDYNLDVKGTSYTDLTNYNSDLSNKIDQTLEGAVAIDNPATIPAIVLTRQNLKGFDDMLKRGIFTIPLHKCFRSIVEKSKLRVNSLKVTVTGAKCKLPKGPCPLMMSATHPGHSELLDSKAQRYHFTHTPRTVPIEYDLLTNEQYSQGMFTTDLDSKAVQAPFAGLYIAVSPLTTWTIQLKTNQTQTADYSAVQDLTLSFKGKYAAFENNYGVTCPFVSAGSGCNASSLPRVDHAKWGDWCDGMEVGGVCPAICDKGFSGPASATCTVGGWEQPSGACRPSSCAGALPAAAPHAYNWASYCQGRSIGQKCIAGCKDGFKPGSDGAPTITCTDSGAWSGTVGSCLQGRGGPHVCSAAMLPDPPTGAKPWPNTCDGAHEHTHCRTTCVEPLTGRISTECQADGSWSFPPTGSCASTTKTGTCNGDLPDPGPNAQKWPHMCKGLHSGHSCSTWCMPGYKPGAAGAPTTGCGADGSWGAVTGSCVKACMGLLPRPADHALPWPVTCWAATVGTRCTANCQPHYKPGAAGAPTITCRAAGDWGGVTGSCVH